MLQNQYMQMANAQSQQRLLSILGQVGGIHSETMAGYSYPPMTTVTSASVEITSPHLTQPCIPNRTKTLGGDLFSSRSIYGAYAA